MGITPGLGRLHSPDARDANFPLKSILKPQSLKLWRYWNDNGWWGDQGSVPQCVAYAWTHWLEDGPITHSEVAPIVQPAELYAEAQKIDEWPGENYDGTSVRAGAKVLQSKGFISSYYWASTVSEIADAILNNGPVVVGTNWYYDMFEPINDVIYPNGVVAGGHAYIINGVNLKKGLFRIKNSWGRSWGGDGRVWMQIEDFEKLLNEDGEACLAVEKK